MSIIKKITILALHLGIGGIEQYISSLCKMLEDDYQIEIISTYKEETGPKVYLSDKVKITYLINDKPNMEEYKENLKHGTIKLKFKTIITMFKLLYLKYQTNKKAIKKIDSDCIITTRDFHNKLVSLFAGKKIIKIATEHNHHNNDQKYIKKVIKSIKGFDYFVLVSMGLYNFYKDKIGTTKAICISNVIDELPKVSSQKLNNNLISVGRLESVKGYLDLVDIINLVKEKISNVKLYLIGDGSLKKELIIKIKKYNLENNIELLGFLPKEKIEKYMVDSSLFVMTSFSESFGLVLTEAMSYKLPCLAFDSAGGACEILKNTGILISNRDKKMMAEKIIELLANKEKLDEIGNNSYQECQKYLSINVKKEWLELLKNII